MNIAVVILNWNGKELLEKFLPSVIAHSEKVATIYVVDNASSDASNEMLRAKFPQVNVIVNSTNGGYAKGYNEGLKKITANYFILLNSDVEVTPNWINPVVELMEANPEIAACQPKILNYIVRDEFEYAGGGGGFIDKWGYPFCRGRIFNSFEKDVAQYDDNKEIFWASGACLFVRSNVYAQAGGLDEDFFAHMEEIDLCWRIRNLGYKIYFSYQSVVYHVGAGTLAKTNPQKTYYNFRNNLLLLFKNHAIEYFYSKLFLRMCLDGVAAAKFLFSGQPFHGIAVIKAHISFYFLFTNIKQKRTLIQKQIVRYASTGVYNGSIVWDYFVKRKKKFSELNDRLFGK
jgi:GT2 family glycosyltransferase